MLAATGRKTHHPAGSGQAGGKIHSGTGAMFPWSLDSLDRPTPLENASRPLEAPLQYIPVGNGLGPPGPARFLPGEICTPRGQIHGVEEGGAARFLASLRLVEVVVAAEKSHQPTN